MTKENLKDRIRNYLSDGKLNLWDAIDLIAQYIDERIPPQKEKEWTTSQSIEKCSSVMLHSNPCTCKTNFDSCKTCGGSGFTNYRLLGDKKAKADKCPECNKPDSCRHGYSNPLEECSICSGKPDSFEDEVGELEQEIERYHKEFSYKPKVFAYKTFANFLISAGYSRHKKQELDSISLHALAYTYWEDSKDGERQVFKLAEFIEAICQSFSKPSKQEGRLDAEEVYQFITQFHDGLKEIWKLDDKDKRFLLPSERRLLAEQICQAFSTEKKEEA